MSRLLIATVICAPFLGVGAEPLAIQGRVVGAGGAAVDGAYALNVAFYPTEEALEAVHTVALPAVVVSDGVFSAVVDLPAALPAAHASLWLGVSVEDDPELPRTRLTATPYAMATRLAPSADHPGTCSPGRVGATYFNTALKRALVCDGGSWQLLGSPDSVAVPSAPGDLVQEVTDFLSSAPGKGSEGFVAPTELERSVFRMAIHRALAGRVGAAAELAGLIGYEVAWLKAAHTYLVLRPTMAGGRGWFAIRPDAPRDVVIESPHPQYDSNSGVRAAELFVSLGARGFVVAGTHRCANAQSGGCDGSTSACGASAPYRISDQAHTTVGLFQVFHEVMGGLAIQIHGMSSGADDPEVSISDGTTANTASPSHLGNLLRAAFETALDGAGGLKPASSCNLTGDPNKLCGTTNTQGRYSNGVPTELACTEAASAANGTFIHIELSKELRTPGGLLEPSVIHDALDSVLP